MSLTAQDLNDIRTVVLDALDVVIIPRLAFLEKQMATIKSSIRHLESVQYEFSRRLTAFETKLTDTDGRLTALHNDVIEIYNMISKLQHQAITDKEFQKLSTDKKLLIVHTEIMTVAQQLNIALPKN